MTGESGPLPLLVRVVQTCRACPSQWNAWDASGQYYYLRYRSGQGSVTAALSEDDYAEGGAHTTLVEFEHGGRWDGELLLGEFLDLAGMTLAPYAEVIPR